MKAFSLIYYSVKKLVIINIRLQYVCLFLKLILLTFKNNILYSRACSEYK